MGICHEEEVSGTCIQDIFRNFKERRTHYFKVNFYGISARAIAWGKGQTAKAVTKVSYSKDVLRGRGLFGSLRELLRSLLAQAAHPGSLANESSDTPNS